MDYIDLTPDEKIEKFLEKRNCKNSSTIIGWSFVIALVLGSIVLATFIRFSESSPQLKLPFIITMILFFIMTILYEPIRQKRRKRDYNFVRKIQGLPEKNIYANPLSNNIRIINAKLNRLSNQGYVFGKEKEILVETGAVQQFYQSVFIETFLNPGDQCFIVCIDNFENPIAVFKGYYNGEKYLTWDCP